MDGDVRMREVIGAKALRYGYVGVDRDNIVEICMEVVGPMRATVRAAMAECGTSSTTHHLLREIVPDWRGEDQ